MENKLRSVKENMNIHMNNINSYILILLLVCSSFVSVSVYSATITIINNDGSNEGLNDNSSFAGAPGNNATTVGQARLNSFLYAAQLLGNELESNVVIQVRANFNSLSCSSNSAILGQAGALTVHRDFTNAPIPGTFYPQALANSYAGSDLSGSPDITATFNSNLNGNPNCLGGTQWYYGTDANNPPGTIDFVTTVIHEIIHGLGFSSQITSSGAFLNAPFPSVYDRFLIDDNLTQLDSANNSTRQAAILSGNGLLWEGLSVREIVNQKTAGTRTISGNEYIQMYAPSPYQGGSSTSHYDTAVFPHEIMEPSLVVDEHDLTFSLALLEDIGWILSNNPPADPEGTNAGECTDGIDNDGDGPIDCNDSDCFSDPDCNNGNTGPFNEINGEVVIEAENFDENNPGNTDNWQLRTVQGGFSGPGYMESLPNNGTSNNTNYISNSPELNYLVNFTNPGTYFVWVRGCGSSGGDDSVHAGINGQQNTTANRMQLINNCSSFVWTRARMSGAPDATINVPGSGIHEINLWMREDGSRVDRILLTTSNDTPSGFGPAESTRDDDPPPVEIFTLNVQTNGGTGTGDVTSSPGGINCGADCSGDYDENEVVTLTPAADSGSTFIQWNGDADCSDGQVTMTSNKTCTAVFDLLPPTTFTLNVQTNGGTGTGDVTSSPGGINCGLDCSGDYDENEVVTLTPAADSGSTFIQWNGDPDCADAQVTMTSNKTCTAVFDLDTPPGGTGPFVESGGEVVMEAENYDDIISRSSKNWELRTNQGGFSGTGYMESRPNTGVSFNTGYTTNSPELIYQVNFTNPGTYFVWLRGCGSDSGNDSAHAGANGAVNTTANRMQLTNNCSSFVWTKARMRGAPDASVTVGSGFQEINLWMREDGSRIDKILLTTNSGFTPSGSGPAESARE